MENTVFTKYVAEQNLYVVNILKHLSDIIVLILIVFIAFHIVAVNQGFDAFLQISGLKMEYRQSLRLDNGFS